MAEFLVDTSVLLDIVTADAQWLSWSRDQFRRAAEQGPVGINPIIYAELAPAFESRAELDRWLRPGLFQRLPLPYDAGYRASQAYLSYRAQGGIKSNPLPDFYIGAHAEVQQLTLITRDRGRYQSSFPKLKLITP